MFEYKDGLQFINIDTDYIKTLSVVCPEVSYKDNDIFKEPDQSVKDNEFVNRILSAIDVKKMIPIRDDVIHIVELNVLDSDSSEEAKYKRLMNKEYSCCVKLKEDILQKAEKIYDKQIKTGKVAKFCCDFRLLEKVRDEYSISSDLKKTEDVVAKNVDNNAKNS